MTTREAAAARVAGLEQGYAATLAAARADYDAAVAAHAPAIRFALDGAAALLVAAAQVWARPGALWASRAYTAGVSATLAALTGRAAERQAALDAAHAAYLARCRAAQRGWLRERERTARSWYPAGTEGWAGE